MTQNTPGYSTPRPSFKQRLAATKRSRWIRFGIVSLLFFAWVAWMGNWWLALLWLLLGDIYITGYIPLTWWKNSKNKTVRTIMSWVDAIVYALVVVYFVFAFIGQNYQIPSSSLEKTLLTGDYLWVNKVLYGPRVPMTPVHFPLVHNKMPILGTDSYLDSPSLSYHRLKGIRNVESGDIVVFNFPAGDTVTTKFEESPEYYYLLVERYGRDRIASDPATFGEIKYRPVDRRQNFVKRAVGLPGETLRIVRDTIYIDGKAQQMPQHAQFAYLLAGDRSLYDDDDYLHSLGISHDDLSAINFSPAEREYLDAAMPGSAKSKYLYMVVLTDEMIERLQADGYINALRKVAEIFPTTGENAFLFPSPLANDWTLSDYGGENGLYIPKKGDTLPLTADNWVTYERCIRNYEGHTDSWFDTATGTAYVDGKPAGTYTFAMDYYFMMGDNRDRSQDSRFWGFVPEDHIVGSPAMVLISFDKDRSMFNGGIRWNRILRDANPDK
ncbi:MAG: signal peptidase I [Muribaculaceae bacterium]|nr:signal peptidase I [Muribaculaceae bacterium]